MAVEVTHVTNEVGVPRGFVPSALVSAMLVIGKTCSTWTIIPEIVLSMEYLITYRTCRKFSDLQKKNILVIACC